MTHNRGSSSSAIRAVGHPNTGHRSWLLPLIVAANVVMFVVTMYFNNCPSHESGCVPKFLGRFSFEPDHENPLFGPSSSTLDKLGATQWYKTVHQGQGWRLVTSMWLHAGIIHLIANLPTLLLIGICLERQRGFVCTAVIYLLSGFGGNILSSLFIRGSISVGSSGAVFGFLGALLSELITNWSVCPNKVAVLVSFVVLLAGNLGIGILPRIDNFGNIGGFLTGFLLGFVLLPRPRFGWTGSSTGFVSKYKAHQYALRFVSLTLLIAGFALGLVLLFKGVNGHDHCPWCHYLNSSDGGYVALRGNASGDAEGVADAVVIDALKDAATVGAGGGGHGARHHERSAHVQVP
nr:RHOMBOID-like protein 2 [Ipomoea batatas]